GMVFGRIAASGAILSCVAGLSLVASVGAAAAVSVSPPSFIRALEMWTFLVLPVAWVFLVVGCGFANLAGGLLGGLGVGAVVWSSVVWLLNRSLFASGTHFYGPWDWLGIQWVAFAAERTMGLTPNGAGDGLGMPLLASDFPIDVQSLVSRGL